MSKNKGKLTLFETIAIIVMVLGVCFMILTTTTSCNKQIVDTTYTFDTAVIYVGGEWITVDVDSWTDYSDGDQIQVKAKDGTTYLVHSNNITLIHSSKDK